MVQRASIRSPSEPTSCETMESNPRRKKKRVRPFQTGTGQRSLSEEERFAFDISGFLILDELLAEEQVNEARSRLEQGLSNQPTGIKRHQNGPEVEVLNVVEGGGVLEDTFASERLVKVMEELIWGRQIRLVASRAIFREPGVIGEITQGGLADPRRYTRYRSFVEGEMRCLMVSCLIALDETVADDGSFCVIPASHKSNFPHPYAGARLEEVPALRPVPLAAGSAVVFSESLSHAMKASSSERRLWLLYQYGPSYMLSWPGCEVSEELRDRSSGDEVKARLLREPYYHP